ncbi:hypothetical protein CGRA01v4_04569 [Colletotrichum graminicola]|uniref:Fucose-specific lectin n=1 Tax=Colletotrichum graminicola (strain M1.001 / M2 / FGSC 10212) TaxID=645133 RepID=E3Q8W0_COLGM|nr:uncharacterized protein GLRG_01969 [Colletotrichum graminicola M1.001]EFQ27474.1 hypothetical protein GLRG_01969 [Colletotrichum graminicola M1.001]WDK13288.1 hypothetical protein CGRA01v4_04569 [Colletotrichum graminicola]
MSPVGAQNRGGERGTDTLPEVYEQPGLEAVPHEQDWSGLEVVSDHRHQDGNKEVIYRNNEDEKIPVVASEAEFDPAAQKSPPASAAARRMRKSWLMVGAGALLLIVAAVVGGVVGSKMAAGGAGRKDSPEAQPTPTPTSTANVTVANAREIRRGSSLAASGWWKNTGSEIFLFYQGDDNKIRRSVVDSTANNTSWQGPEELDSFATENSRLAGSTIVYDTGYVPQPELFYTNAQMQVLGISMNDLYTPTAQEDSIKTIGLRTIADSSVASYWPWSVHQAADGYIVEVRNRLIGGDFHPAAEWDAKRLRVQAVNASRLALVPTSTSFNRIAIQGGYGIFYQAANSSLVALIPDLANNVPADYVTSWPTDFPSITLPEHGTFAAFSVARPSDSLQRVDTYVLYLDASSDINVVYTDSSASSSPSWKTAQPDALKGADADTDIACVTMATSAYDSSREAVPLRAAASMVRCYFQREGLVREVTLSGNQWVDIGSVPIS